jgi:hypothetical protein
VEGLLGRLYSKLVTGLSPGPRRRGGAMAMLDGAPRRQGSRQVPDQSQLIPNSTAPSAYTVSEAIL